MEDQLKKAFDKVKNDINFLNNEILELKISIDEINNHLKNMELLSENQRIVSSTDRHINQTDSATSTDSSTVPIEVGGLKTTNLDISIGNEGVSTDRQTDNSTDNSTHFSNKNRKINTNHLKEAVNILESLDILKKEIRLKFKHLTPQEMLVFSTIYQLEDLGNKEITYNSLSKTLKLSESSIRDYIQRMINKGIPIKKEKINNKKITLLISQELKKIATLSTILQLREL